MFAHADPAQEEHKREEKVDHPMSTHNPLDNRDRRDKSANPKALLSQQVDL